MVWDTADAGFAAIQEAYFANTMIEAAVMDGAIAIVGSQGLRATVGVFSFKRNAALEEAITVDVTLRPTYAANAPEWMVIPRTPSDGIDQTWYTDPHSDS